MNRSLPVLYLVIPCYNEQEVLPVTAPQFREKLRALSDGGQISDKSRILFVDDGSKDSTWDVISKLAAKDPVFTGIRQSRNRGHQNAVLAGLMEACDKCDITVSIDCDGQDDINAVDKMIEEYKNGCEIVYGVRGSRQTDTFFKRTTAQGFYKFLNFMGAEVVYNHADYRLVSSKALKEFASFKEVNLFLRGMFPLVGFKSTSVYYERHERLAGKSHYPLRKMLALALDGITGLSTKPLGMIVRFGLFIAFLSFVGILYSVFSHLFGSTVSGWTSMMCVICFVSGIQLICLGVIGTYIGKIYMEVKARPRYIISERTTDTDGENS